MREKWMTRSILAEIEFLSRFLAKGIADKFLVKLSESKDVDAEKINQLRKLLADHKKPKAEDFVKIFSIPAGGDLK